MLDCIGESPVSSLAQAGLVFVDKARSTLREVSRKVQVRGWHFNTQENYTTARNVNNEIPVSDSIMAIDTMPQFAKYDVQIVGGRLYDKTNQTYTFTEDPKFRVVWFREWDDLPEVARQFIMIRAARIFQSRQLGSATLHQFSAQEEQEAYLAFIEGETEQGDYNVFDSSWSVASILDRPEY